jgi:hypothetical protein
MDSDDEEMIMHNMIIKRAGESIDCITGRVLLVDVDLQVPAAFAAFLLTRQEIRDANTYHQ